MGCWCHLCCLTFFLLFTQVFAYFLRPHHGVSVPGAPFFLGAGLMAGAFVVALRVTRVVPPAAVTAAS